MRLYWNAVLESGENTGDQGTGTAFVMQREADTTITDAS